jgi:hypothetical protein
LIAARRVEKGQHAMGADSRGGLHPIESKYIAVAAVVGFLLALLLSDGSLLPAFGAFALVAGLGWVAQRLSH